ncbi:hypothetical protein NUM3379_38010 [Kineococcus sp. NUM-3379]
MARAAFLASALLHAVVLAVAAVVLPERVPLHFGAGLHADRWGERGELLLADALVAALLAGLFAGLAALTARVPLQLVNVPSPAYWKSPEHEAELRRRLRDDVLGLGAATLAFAAAACALTVHAAATGSGRLSLAFAALLVLYLGATVAWCAHLVLVRYAVPHTGPPPRGRPAGGAPASRR